MKAVLIDPAAKTVNLVDVHSVRRATNMFFGEKPTPTLKLPHGDVLLAAAAADGAAFTLGGSRSIGGSGLIVGRRLDTGEHGSARIDLNHVAQMVRWTSIEKSEALNRVCAIEIDPGLRSIEEFLISPTMLAVQHRLGGEIRIRFRAPGGDVVFAAGDAATDLPEWRKDDATFAGRCVIVGHDSRSGCFVDVAASLTNLRESVSFRRPSDDSWTSYGRESEG